MRELDWFEEFNRKRANAESFGSIRSWMPSNFQSCHRIFHPFYRSLGHGLVTWRAVAAEVDLPWRCNLSYQEMYLAAVMGSRPWILDSCYLNVSPPLDQFESLIEALSEGTSGDELWLVFSEGVSEDSEQLVIEQRALLGGEIVQLLPATKAIFDELDRAPNACWPADHSWIVRYPLDCVGSTLVGASNSAVYSRALELFENCPLEMDWDSGFLFS